MGCASDGMIPLSDQSHSKLRHRSVGYPSGWEKATAAPVVIVIANTNRRNPVPLRVRGSLTGSPICVFFVMPRANRDNSQPR
jgi:hypothetical protein